MRIIAVMGFRRFVLLRSGAALLLSLAPACVSRTDLGVSEDPPNVLLICVDDLRPELGAFGVEYIHSPHIDGLAAEGRSFTRHYVQAPTCGASRYALLIGRYSEGGAGRGNDALVQRARRRVEGEAVAPSLPELFRAAGYTSVSVGKVSHHPGGRFGENWNDPQAVEMPGAWDRNFMPSGPWLHPRGDMHGLANGLVRIRGETPVLESFPGDERSYPDGWIADMALEELRSLAFDDEPFFLAVGFIRPHLPFGAPASYMRHYEGIELPPIPHAEKPEGRTTWHGSGEFFGGYAHGARDPRSDAEYAAELRRHYAACVSYVDHLVGRLLGELERLRLEEETVVVLWGDHGWHLGEHGVWGKHTLFEESLRSPLIVRVPGLQEEGARSAAIVETVDLLPTLCELAGIPAPEDLDGRSLVPQLRDPGLAGHAAISYRSHAETLRTPRHRLIRHVEAGETVALELYDHESDPGETRNLAEAEPVLAAELLEVLVTKLHRTP